MKRDHTHTAPFYKSLPLFLAGLLITLHGLATTYTSTGSGPWATTTTWSPNGTPTASDDVIIQPGHIITMNANPGACQTLYLYGTITWTAARTLSVGVGGIVFHSGAAITGTATGTLNVSGVFQVTTGTQTIGQVAMTVTGGSIFNGVLTYTSATGAQTFNGAAIMNNGSAIIFSTTRTLNFNGGVSTSGTTSVSGAATGTVNMGSLSVPSGSAFTITNTNLSVTGTTTIGGNIVYGDANGTKAFGNITVSSGGTWDCSGYDEFFTVNGTLTNSGTFKASATTTGANEYKFTNAASAIAGTLTIPNVSVASGAVLTNNGVLTITDSLYGSGKYVQGASSTLNYNSPKLIVVTTFNPSGASNLVDYLYPGAQTVAGGGSVKYYDLNISTSGTKTLGNSLNVLDNLTVQGTTTLDVDATNNYSVSVGGNWSLTSTSPSPFLQQQGTVTFNGSTGVQAISTTVAGGQTFYNVTFNNTSTAVPSLTTAGNLNVTHNTTFTQGNLDLQGHNFIITGDVTGTTEHLNGGLIMTSTAGSTFKVTDPNSNKITYYNGTQIGTSTTGITISDTSGRIQFQGFTQYGTANFVKTLNVDDVFGGGNVYYGPVTFTAAPTASRWRMGDNAAAPDTFYNATFNALANGGSNNNFIVGANSLGNAFYGTTAMTSVTPGGFFVCRQNGTGNASATFYGPVVATIGLTGNMTFADAASGNVNSVTFDNTITLNSTSTSTGFFHFADNNQYGTVTLTSGGQFLTGSISGQTNVYLCNLTQLGPKTQTINTAGSSGALYVGGTTSLPAFSCTFNGPCNFTADTAGYFVGSRFNGATTVTVNHANANGYIIGDTTNAGFSAIVGNIRFQNNVFNGTTTLQHTSSFTSSSNGGNTFNGFATIVNSGTGTLRQGGYNGLGDAFNNDVTYLQNTVNSVISPAYNSTSTYAGNISVSGSLGSSIVFANGAAGNMTINGSGTQLFVNGASAAPFIGSLTMATAAPNNILQMGFSTQVSGTLTMTQGLINLNSNKIILGSSATAPGTLNYTSGWLYGGAFVRWFAKTSVAIPSTTGLFPMGSDPSAMFYHPLWFGYTANLTTGGTLSVTHNPTLAGYTTVTYWDASWGYTVKGVSNSAWAVSSGNGLTVSGTTAQVRFGGTGYGIFSLPDLNASLAFSAIGTFANATNATVPLEVNRTGLTGANLNNTWRIGIRDVTMSPLPVQLTSFNARLTPDGVVDLNWSTATEINNKLFTVEKSQDGIFYTPVAEVAGAGNSSVQLDYSATDPNPYAGVSYYRLKQTNEDGQSTYSRVVPINVSTNVALRLYPNPARTNLQLTFSSGSNGSVVTRIIDAAGKVMATRMNAVQPGVNTINFSVAGYRFGTYFLEIISTSENRTIPFSVY